jgi:hypothetical protein
MISYCMSLNGIFDQSKRYDQKIILEISIIYRLVPVLQRGGYFFRMPLRSVGFTLRPVSSTGRKRVGGLILNKNPHLWMDTNLDGSRENKGILSIRYIPWRKSAP